MPSASRHVRRSWRGVRIMAVSRSQYTAARRLVRQNGVYALRWLPKDVRECVEAVLFSQLVDQLALRMDRGSRKAS